MQVKHSVLNSREYTIESRRRAVERVIHAMRERLGEPLTLEDMAKVAYLSPFHFNRVFHQTTGLPPTKFLYAMRLEEAKRLLLTTRLSVTDVCYEVGYNSLGTFTTRFTQLIGLSPCHLRGLAGHITPASFRTLCSNLSEEMQSCRGDPSITGRILSPGSFQGIIFVGLFRSYIPQSQPAAGAVLTRTGPFSIANVPEGCYHLCAAAFPEGGDALTYLLPDHESMLVGVGQSHVNVRGGRSSDYTELTLRPMQLTDPPLLISLPNLLAKLLIGGGHFMNGRGPVMQGATV